MNQFYVVLYYKLITVWYCTVSRFFKKNDYDLTIFRVSSIKMLAKASRIIQFLTFYLQTLIHPAWMIVIAFLNVVGDYPAIMVINTMNTSSICSNCYEFT